MRLKAECPRRALRQRRPKRDYQLTVAQATPNKIL